LALATSGRCAACANQDATALLHCIRA
jgi:hypothetical protein